MLLCYDSYVDAHSSIQDEISFLFQDRNLDVAMRPLEGQSSLVSFFIKNVVFVPVDPYVHVNSISDIISLRERLEAVDEPLGGERGKESDMFE